MIYRSFSVMVALSLGACNESHVSDYANCADLEPATLLSQVQAQLDPLMGKAEGLESRSELERATRAVKEIAFKAEECFYFYGDMPRGELPGDQRELYGARMHGFLDISTGLRWVITNLDANASLGGAMVGSTRDWKFSYTEFLKEVDLR